MGKKKLKINSLGAIELLGMEFHANHGCLESERAEGNTFIVDFVGHTDIKRAALTDSLQDTLDYSAVYSIIKREMQAPSCLLESVAGRIVDAIARETKGLLFIQVTVAKKTRPWEGPAHGRG